MKTITSFDKSTVKVVIRPEVERALKVLEQYGIVASIGTIRFNSNDLRFKVEMRVNGNRTSGAAQITEPIEVLNLRAFEKSHPEYGQLVNRSLMVGGKSFVIKGYKPSRHKFPFSVDGVLGGKYKLSINNVRQSIGLPIAPLGRPFRF